MLLALPRDARGVSCASRDAQDPFRVGMTPAPSPATRAKVGAYCMANPRSGKKKG